MNLKIFNEIEDIVSELECEIQKYKAIILTESDFKCQLYRQLYFYDEIKETLDYKIYGNQIHTEIKFYAENEHLQLIPDITILEQQHLSILKSVEPQIINGLISYPKLPSKQFQFSGNSTIIELKYVRNKNGITAAQIKSFQKDIDKIKYLQNLNNPNGNQIYGIFIILNKTSIKTLNFDYFVHRNSEENLKIIYLTQNVTF